MGLLSGLARRLWRGKPWKSARPSAAARAKLDLEVGKVGCVHEAQMRHRRHGESGQG
jgi:hypothetical protein